MQASCPVVAGQIKLIRTPVAAGVPRGLSLNARLRVPSPLRLAANQISRPQACERNAVRCSGASSAAAPAPQQPSSSQPSVERSVDQAVVACVRGFYQLGASAKQWLAAVMASMAEQATAARLKQALKQVKYMGMVAAPFASATTGDVNTFILITQAVGNFIKLYLLLLFVRVLLSWFPSFDWNNNPWLALRQITDPYLNLFRGLVPPLLGTIDLTPLFGFLILQFLASALDVSSEDDMW